MDGGIFSYLVNCVKPDEEIYYKLFEKYDLNPAECVFIDDTPANIETARRLGMQGIVFESYEQSSSELTRILG